MSIDAVVGRNEVRDFYARSPGLSRAEGRGFAVAMTGRYHRAAVPGTPPKARLVSLETAVFLGGFVALVATAAAGLSLGDGGELDAAAFTLGVGKAPGAPLFVLMGKAAVLVPLGSVATRLNLLSALISALAMWLVLRAVRALTEGVAGEVAALFAALLLLAGVLVRHGTVASLEAPAAAVAALALWLGALVMGDEEAARRARSGRLLGLVTGLALGLGSPVRFALAPPLGVFALVRLRRGDRWPLLAPLAFSIGAAVLLLVPLAAAMPTTAALEAPRFATALWHFLVGERAFDHGSGAGSEGAAGLVRLARALERELGLPSLGAAAVGIANLLARRRAAGAMVLWLGIAGALAGSTGSGDPVAATALAVAAGVGVWWMATRITGAGARPIEGSINEENHASAENSINDKHPVNEKNLINAESHEKTGDSGNSGDSVNVEHSAIAERSAIVAAGRSAMVAVGRAALVAGGRSAVVAGALGFIAVAPAALDGAEGKFGPGQTAAAWTRAALGDAPSRALVLSSSDDLSAGIRYAQWVEGARPDVTAFARPRLWEGRYLVAASASSAALSRTDAAAWAAQPEPVRRRDARQFLARLVARNLHARAILWEPGGDAPPSGALVAGAVLFHLEASPSPSPPALPIAQRIGELIGEARDPEARRLEAAALTRVGEWFAASGDDLHAGPLFELALNARRDDGEAATRLAEVKGRLGDASGALALIERVLERDPTLRAARLEAGALRLAAGDFAGAEREFLCARRDAGDDPAALVGLGRVAHARGDDVAARRWAAAALALAPTDGAAKKLSAVLSR